MLYLVIVFVSAFLLFQVQPLMAKLLLPLFGGGAAVWTSCLLFFQVFLLFGYLYAHLLTQIHSLRKQVYGHCGLLLASLLLLPVSMEQLWQTVDQSTPLKAIMGLLFTTIGLPYLLLSATGPLVQRWYSYQYNGAGQQALPYKLYSWSNIGSLLALVSYPFIIEPRLSMDWQTLSWSGGYMVLVLAFVVLGRKLWLLPDEVARVEHHRDDISVKGYGYDSLLWVLLGAVGVVLLISTTNAMTQNIAPVPFLWILPLCLYLLSFIVCFNNERWYVRWYWGLLFVICSFAALLMYFIGSGLDIVSQLVLYSMILLSSCMICHGELARLKPKVEKLTLFYLNISLGGALGSIFVSFLAPQIFDQFYEFVLAILAVYVLFICCLSVKPHDSEPAVDKRQLAQFKLAKVAAAVLMLLVGLGFYTLNGMYGRYDVATARNFYGILSVKDVTINGKPQRRLIDGTTSHGTQSLEPGLEGQPLSYYRQHSGGALVLQHFAPERGIKAGFIGLGAGALAAYGRRGDDYRFYELNPAVEQMAKQHFSFLSRSQARVSVVLGDGRMTLTKALLTNNTSGFDVLVLDAFSGDSIPSHLLTIEAFELYWQHLNHEGVLAVHISNSHLALSPLIRGLADKLGKSALYFETTPDSQSVHTAQWVLISNNLDFLDRPEITSKVSMWPLDSIDNLIWTDNYSNLLSVLK